MRRRRAMLLGDALGLGQARRVVPGGVEDDVDVLGRHAEADVMGEEMPKQRDLQIDREAGDHPKREGRARGTGQVVSES